MFTIPQVDPEFKNLIPPLSADEREQLEQNILSVGKCKDAIILWEGIIVDGHNRFEICMKHGIEFEIVEMPFSSREEAMVWMLDNQLGKRNLTDAARIELVLAKSELIRERARRKKSLLGGNKRGLAPALAKTSTTDVETIDVRKIIATEAGVGDRTLHRYMDIKQTAPPELLDRVKSGELRISTAHRLLEKELLKQLRNATKAYKFIIKNANAAPDIPDCITKLSQQLHALINQLEDTQC